MKQLIGLINRILAVLLYGYSLYVAFNRYLPTHGLPAHFAKYKGVQMGFKMFVFLTIWNVTFNLIFFTTALFCQLFPSLKSGREPSFRDVFFHSVIVPLSMTVTGTFWTIYVYDKDLIWPDYLANGVPYWFNNGVHTMIVVTAFLEGYCYYHKLPRQETAYKWLCGILFLYGFMTLYLGFRRDIWLYPVLRALPHFRKILFIISVNVAALFFHNFGERVHQKCWKHQTRRVSFSAGPDWKY